MRTTFILCIALVAASSLAAYGFVSASKYRTEANELRAALDSISTAEALRLEPHVGGIYENLLTGDRIRIDSIGTGAELRDHYDRMKDLLHEITDSPALRLSLLTVPRVSDADTAKLCFSYVVEEGVSAPGGRKWSVEGRQYSSIPVRFAVIEPIEKLKTDYKKLN